MRKLIVPLIVCLVGAVSSAGADGTKDMKDEKKEVQSETKDLLKTLKDAEVVLHEATAAPDKGIPRDLLQKAECVGVFPGVKKGAFVVGGEYGKGVFICRSADGSMGPPAFFSLGGGSVGWQFGGQEADLVLLVMNQQGISHLLKDRFTLGGEASAVAGPVGRTARAATDLQVHAQLLSWSRSRGAFLGASLGGAVVKPDADANAALYGRSVSAKELLVDGKAPVPPSAQAFVTTTTELSRRS